MASPQPAQERSRNRRDALLRAAIDLLADGGARAVTHRAVAARAGVPQSATTYYFESIGKLTEAALRLQITERVAELREIATNAALGGRSVTQIAERFVTALLDRDPRSIIAQFEVYLEAARNPALREPVAEALEESERLAHTILAGLGARRPAAAAHAVVAVVNGFALNRLARPRDPSAEAAAMLEAIRAVFVMQIMGDDELAAWLARLDRPLGPAALS